MFSALCIYKKILVFSIFARENDKKKTIFLIREFRIFLTGDMYGNDYTLG